MSVQATFSATLVDEWVRCGVTDAVICPGSRSTPLALALAARLKVHVRLDERSAGFYAVGLALATGRPTVICVTSGTAAAELHPAVVEAHHARVPLIVCTADRPPELLDTGAPQTIDQVGLFTTATRWSVQSGRAHARAGARSGGPWPPGPTGKRCSGPSGPGPVHLNLAFREPLTGTPDELPDRPGPAIALAGRDAAPASDLAPLAGNGIIIVGGLTPEPPTATLVQALAERLEWPVLADPRSGCRYPGTIAAADAIVRTEPPLPRPCCSWGHRGCPRPWATYVSRRRGRKGRGSSSSTPGASGPTRRGWPPSSTTATSTNGWRRRSSRRRPATRRGWLRGERWRMPRRAPSTTTLADELSEPQVARQIYAHAAGSGATVVVSASMPIRDLEWYAAPQPSPPRVLANRGANGIDGVVSTALGVAAAADSGSDDRTAWVTWPSSTTSRAWSTSTCAAPCTFVVVDNGGGGIFSFLPQAGALEPEVFERLFGTPPRSDIGAVARGFGLTVHEVTTMDELKAALDQPAPAVIQVRVPGRAENVALHEAINQAVRRALG